MKAYVVTRSGDLIEIPYSEWDLWESGGHDVFDDRMRALLYFDRTRRFDLQQTMKG